ncbi:hypothetical protein TREMEDRAFT_41009 [Tremella mesenterica DSM 1558]|uniref:uncharacterized protein n=1 Tax=Tremella mesenterica (strain ATCC 24925 / CBS 8224 / DSM 1558 / NBRC 9311 / NRRL Y-6157 / RJB 2259-6 / UBC 559-6) TaxID=578456 RepID=UPI00032D632F|nr:uncharacterized protein TREMEDRAFT_41009 [Tremella mesenterica DSM 1558]EIW66373.1 hypothetical protein TREMEDRAFT_41009 [Tremella mesenterica DSM 1558]
MSTDLQWLLLRQWNSFQVKPKNGKTFSKEKGNLLNLHSHKYSGLANSKVVNIDLAAEGNVVITKIKGDAKPTQVASARTHVTLRRNTGPRRVNKIVAVETAHKGYRADLRHAAVARASAVLKAHKQSLNPPKEYPIKVRGKKGKAFMGAEKTEDDVIELD